MSTYGLNSFVFIVAVFVVCVLAVLGHRGWMGKCSPGEQHACYGALVAVACAVVAVPLVLHLADGALGWSPALVVAGVLFLSMAAWFPLIFSRDFKPAIAQACAGDRAASRASLLERGERIASDWASASLAVGTLCSALAALTPAS